MQQDIARTLITADQIAERVDRLSQELTAHYTGKDLIVIGVLTGSFLFMADLLRRMPIPLEIACLSVASYVGTSSTGNVRFLQTELPQVHDRHLLILDDILDTGRTLSAVTHHFSTNGAPRSLRTCVLLRKDVPRVEPIDAHYVAFDIPNAFVVGYGLDYNGYYRNLPSIGVLTDDAIQRLA